LFRLKLSFKKNEQGLLKHIHPRLFFTFDAGTFNVQFTFFILV
jgi:hypothetical protein